MEQTLTLFHGADGFELPVAEKENWIMLREFGYSPVQSLVAAVGACGGYVYHDVLDNSKIAHELVEVRLSYTRDEEKRAHPIKTITIVFVAKGVAADLQGRAERALRLVSPNCPVIQTLSADVEIHESVKFI